MIITLSNGNSIEVPAGTTLKAISERENVLTTLSPVMAAYVNGKLTELSEIMMESAKVDFLTLDQVDGYRIYQRSLTMLFLRSAYEVLGNDTNIEVKYSLKNALFCEISDNEAFEEDPSGCIARIKAKMYEHVDHPEPIVQVLMDLPEAVEVARQQHLPARARLFSYRRFSFVHMYKNGKYMDYFYGFMLPDTSKLSLFDLVPWDEGVSLLMPERSYPHNVTCPEESPKLMEVFKQSKGWGEILEVSDIGALNQQISKGKIRQLIYTSEALHQKQLSNIAEEIVEREDLKLILIAGPSSSGKTTFAQKLCIQLRAEGKHPHLISTDNYFIDRDRVPILEDGSKDYENLNVLDLEQFQQDLSALMEGKEITLPEYDFVTGKQYQSTRKLKLQSDDILVVEGIHCMNEQLTIEIPRSQKYKIYISALTQLSIDEHNRIPTTDGRLLRRMVRDHAQRGYSASETINQWNTVRRGEDQYIFPFQEDADMMFNSALPYEMAVLKQFAEPLLLGIPHGTPEYVEARRLIKFLDYFQGISSEEVPQTSLLREFIGGSVYDQLGDSV